MRPCDIKLTAVAKGNILKKATLQLIRVDSNGDDDQIQVVQANSRVAVDLGAEYRITASARGHRQVGLLKTFIATPETFLKQPGPVALAVDMAPDVGAIDLAVLDVVGRPLRHARVSFVAMSEVSLQYTWVTGGACRSCRWTVLRSSRSM